MITKIRRHISNAKSDGLGIVSGVIVQRVEEITVGVGEAGIKGDGLTIAKSEAKNALNYW
jgi:hypothetical protein